MWIKRVEIENYKSFLQQQAIDLAQGFNLILGANNAGKSTVLQALDLAHVPDVAHRSVANTPVFGMHPLGHPRVVMSLSMSAQEMREMRKQNAVWFLPIRPEHVAKLSAMDYTAMVERLLSERDLTFVIERGGAHRVKLLGELIGSELLTNGGGDVVDGLYVVERPDGPTAQSAIQRVGGAGDELWQAVSMYAQRVYRFEASRKPSSAAPLSESGNLLSDASNLASCITHLMTNDAEGHRQLCQWVSRVLPHVRWVQAPPVGGGMVELRCLPRPHVERREDLAVPIHQMGSGVGNVLAALYVVLTARSPQVICIDEPNQFLHPKALRELLQILATEGRQHQYILTAHSAEVISAIKAETVTLLTLVDGVTCVQQTNHAGLATLRDGFADLGIRATELHGRDRVLWVEGQTEELVLPALLAHFCPEHSAGTAVLRVQDTGAFEQRRIEPIKVVEIYKRLTGASALVPPMVAVILDREKRDAAERERLEADRRAVLRFLPRRMLENFLIHPGAISDLLTSHGEEVDPDAISGHLPDLSEIAECDGAAVLARVIEVVAGSKQTFKKTRDVPVLVDWLLTNEPEHLRPLGDWLAGLLNEQEAMTRAAA